MNSTLEKPKNGWTRVNGEFSPFRTSMAIIAILLTAITTIGWFWITSVSAEQRVIIEKYHELDKRITEESGDRKADTKFIENELKYIRESLRRIEERMDGD